MTDLHPTTMLPPALDDGTGGAILPAFAPDQLWDPAPREMIETARPPKRPDSGAVTT